MKRNRSIAVWLLSTLLVLPAFAKQNKTATSEEGHWVGTWASSAQLGAAADAPPAPGFTDSTLRQIVHVSIGGKQLRLKFSNAFGASALTIPSVHIALSAAGSAIQAQSDKAVTFHGELSVTIPSGALMVSDPVEFDVAPLSDLAVTIHLNGVPNEITMHPGSRETSYLVAGDSVSTVELTAPAQTDHWYFLSGVDVLAASSSAAVVVLGDSITDGHGATTNKNDRWPDGLAGRLQKNKSTAGVGVLNEGIGGNRLLRDGIGQNALARFDRDVLAQTSVRWLIVLEGINDIGTRLSARKRNQPFASLRDMIGAYEQIIARAHAHNIRVYGATITPYEGAGFYFTPDGEADRQAINQWIRSSGKFDGVIDFDAVTRDTQSPTHLSPIADSGDHLHPGAKGYQIMGDAIDLKLFTK